MTESFVVQSRWDVNIDPATRNMLKFAAELRKTDALLDQVQKKLTGFRTTAMLAAHASSTFSTTTGAGMAAAATSVARLTTRLGRLQSAASGLHAPTSFANQTAAGLNNVSNSAAHAITMLGRLRAASAGARGHGRGWGSPASNFHNAMASFQEARMMFTPLTAPLDEASKYQNQMLAAKTSAFAQGGDSYRQYMGVEPQFRGIIRGAQRDTMFSTAEISGFLGSSIAGGITPDQIKEGLLPRFLRNDRTRSWRTPTSSSCASWTS